MAQIGRQAWLDGMTVAEAHEDTRADFIRKTYAHLAAAVLLFAGIEAVLFGTGVAQTLTATLLAGPWTWAIVLGVFMVVSWFAHSAAQSATSLGVQYAALGVYVLVQSVIFCPLLLIAQEFVPGAITTAAIATGGIFGGITVVAFATGKDFSFLGGALTIGMVAMLVIAVASAIFGFTLGLAFVVFGIALAGGFILYDTSNVIHHYRIGQHVAASLSLFASLALLFWYVLRFVMIFMSEE